MLTYGIIVCVIWCDSKYGMCMNGTTIHCMNKAWEDSDMYVSNTGILVV